MAKNSTHTSSGKASPDAARARSASPRSKNAEPLRRFDPHDTNEFTPARLPSAMQAFSEAPRMNPGTEVDPMAALSKEERAAHRRELGEIVQAQKHAETLVGVSMRP